MAKKKIFVSFSDFRDFIERGGLYIDKTKYLWELVSNGEKYNFMSRPRRFGKSLFLSALDYYFQGRRDLFKGLAIEKLATDDKDWEPQPILRLDMAAGSSAQGLENAVRNMQCMLVQAAQDLEIEPPAINNPEIMLSELISRLYARNKKPIVVLIDEYDMPILSMLYTPNAKKMLDLCHDFYWQLKTSDKKIRFVFITGVSRFAGVSLFSGFNNPNVLTFNEDFADMLGYTQEEMEAAFEEFMPKAMEKNGLTREELLDRVREYYNGFRYHSNFPSLYNPISIANFFKTGEFRNYWAETGNPRFLIERLRDKPFDLDNYTRDFVDEVMPGKTKIDDINAFSLAIESGYLTVKEWRRGDEGQMQCKYGFPNREIADSWHHDMLRLATEIYDDKPITNAQKLRGLLKKGDTDAFMERLDWYFANASYENAPMEHEGNYRNYMALVFSLVDFPYGVEVQTSDGRVDIAAHTPEWAFCFEVKTADLPDAQAEPEKREAAIDKIAREALDQAVGKRYADRYKTISQNVRVIGLVFDKATRRIAGWR